MPLSVMVVPKSAADIHREQRARALRGDIPETTARIEEDHHPVGDNSHRNRIISLVLVSVGFIYGLYFVIRRSGSSLFSTSDVSPVEIKSNDKATQALWNDTNIAKRM